MNHGAKLLIGCFVFGAIVCVWGCWYDNTHPSNRRWTGEIAHVEVHADRPLAQAIYDTIRDREDPDYEAPSERESDRDRDISTDFESMS